MIKREIIETLDGSPSLWWEEIGEHYHSTKGAFQESQHIFIGLGMQALNLEEEEIHILEMGFGTGLNAILALMEGERTGKRIHFTSLELYPLDEAEVQQLDLAARIGREDLKGAFQEMHQCLWGIEVEINPNFFLTKIKKDLRLFKAGTDAFHCIFFDAFSPNVQPELWTEEIFQKMYTATKPGGNLTTYCAKGTVKRALMAAGYKVEGLPGPPGKREVRRASKLIANEEI